MTLLRWTIVTDWAEWREPHLHAVPLDTLQGNQADLLPQCGRILVTSSLWSGFTDRSIEIPRVIQISGICCPESFPMAIVGLCLTVCAGCCRVWYTLILGLAKWVSQCWLSCRWPHKLVLWTGKIRWSLIPSRTTRNWWKKEWIWVDWSLLTQRLVTLSDTIMMG